MTLAEARIAANDARKLVASGVNPIEERRRAKEPLPSTPTFGECAKALIASKESGWRNAKHRQQWANTLRDYAKPLWSRPVDSIDVAGVLECLQPKKRRVIKLSATRRPVQGKSATCRR
jgi:hypothetical protein